MNLSLVLHQIQPNRSKIHLFRFDVLQCMFRMMALCHIGLPENDPMTSTLRPRPTGFQSDPIDTCLDRLPLSFDRLLTFTISSRRGSCTRGLLILSPSTSISLNLFASHQTIGIRPSRKTSAAKLLQTEIRMPTCFARHVWGDQGNDSPMKNCRT